MPLTYAIPLPLTFKLVPAKGRWCSAAGKVTADLAESSDSHRQVCTCARRTSLADCLPRNRRLAPTPRCLSITELHIYSHIQKLMDCYSITAHSVMMFMFCTRKLWFAAYYMFSQSVILQCASAALFVLHIGLILLCTFTDAIKVVKTTVLPRNEDR